MVSTKLACCNAVFGTLAILLVAFVALTKCEIKKEEKTDLKERTVKMFYHAYDSYMKYAYPADELMPLSCKGRYRGSEPDRGDIDETLGNFSLTLIDTLDTLAVLGNVSEFEKAVGLVISEVSFDTDVVVSVFETNIRVLGGLLGGHVVSTVLQKEDKGMKWYRGELLDMAVDIADRLLVAFNTTTGIPYSKVNLLHGIHHPMSRIVNEKDTCTACGGTMIMEFAALSRLTGNPIYEEKARKAMESIWHYRSRHSDLVGTVIDVHNGDWIRRDSGIGAGIDSYYEYCLKAYILLGDTSYLEKFNKHYAAINKYIRQGVMMLDVLMHQPDRPIRSFVDSLQAFWPGLQVLMGDLKPAIETHEMLYEVAKRHKFIPEAFTTNFDLYWSQHPLRPEFAESTYFLYEATKDPYYLEVGKHIIETLEEHAKVQCGFAAIKDLRTFTHEDKMDSFVLAETFKYLYLLFSEDSDRILNIHNFIFTTEAHLLPLSLGNVNYRKQDQQYVVNKTKTEKASPEKKESSPSSCPNDAKDRYSMREFARIVRKAYRKPAATTPMCSASTDSKLPEVAFTFDPNREPKLRAEHFQVGNTEHMQLLKDMGITVTQASDGKVQLIHQAGTAATTEDASDGIKFMQDMIQISKARGGDQASTVKPRVVQLMSPPFNGEVFFGAGAAQFGLDISNHQGIVGEVVDAIPFNACSEIENSDEFEDRIVIAQRGGCMFIDKVRRAQSFGAKGVIIIDHNENTSADQPMFAMSGDSHSEDVVIPSVFLFRKEGDVLRSHAQKSIELNNIRLEVRLASSAKRTKETETKKEVNTMDSIDPSNENEQESKEKTNDALTTPDSLAQESDLSKGSSEESKEDNKTKEEHVLDKMESSMEKSPKVVIVNGQKITTKVETHIGKNDDGDFVTYESTFVTYENEDEKGNSHVRVTTRIIPFRQSALEIDKERLEHASNSDAVEKIPATPKYNGDDKLELEEEIESGDDERGASEQKFNKNGLRKEGNTVAHDTNDKLSNVPILNQKTAEKGDTGLNEKEDDHLSSDELADTQDDKENRGQKRGQRKHDSLEKQQVTTEAPGETGTENSRKKEPVICNSAGCFSSIEQLEMFNELALKVRSNLGDWDNLESMIKEQSSKDNVKSPSVTSESTDDSSSKSKPSTR